MKCATTMLCKFFALIIRAYQIVVSPFLPSTCRFYPSCSAYAIQALEKYRFLKSAILIFKRIFKCHPFHEGGVDPVP